MAQIIGLPKLSPTMEEGVLVRWTKQEGDKVAPGDLIAEVETDKANMDFNIEDDGVLLKLLVKEGDTVKLGAPVLIIGKAGEDIAALVEQAASGGGGGSAPPAPAAKSEDPGAVARKAAPANQASTSQAAATGNGKAGNGRSDGGTRPGVGGSARPAAAGSQTVAKGSSAAAKPEDATLHERPPTGGKILASPLAKSLAVELGIDLRTIEGTGPGGRIVERDVRGAVDNVNTISTKPAQRAQDDAQSNESTAIAIRPAPVQLASEYEDHPASNMRKRIAARLTEAKRDVPHFYLQRTIDAEPLLAFRERLNALLGDRGKVSVNDLVVKAVALALRRVPECNASWEGDAIRRFKNIHIGIAVAIEDGLVTPVVRDADLKGLGSISNEVRDLATRAKNKGLKGHEITGSTFTVSNLGMLGIERFTAIINPPEAGILAIGAVLDVPVVKNGQVVAGKRMTVSMSCDHRVIDGALGAKWLVEFADLIEHPESLAL